MSGDTKTTKSEELFYRFILDINVNKEIDSIRNGAGIPVDGFKRVEDGRRWLNRMPRKKYRELLDRYYDLLNKYKLPDELCNLVEGYIFCGLRADGLFHDIDHLAFCQLDPSIKLESYYSNRPFVKLLIFEEADEDYVKKFIERSWKHIKRRLAEKGAFHKRLSPIVKTKRNFLIMRLYAKSEFELAKILNYPIAYKKEAISSIMKKLHGIIISGDAVEKVFYQYRYFKRF